MNNIIYIMALVAAVWVIYDVLTSKERMDTAKKVIWIIAALLFSVIAAIFYYFIEKNKKSSEA